MIVAARRSGGAGDVPTAAPGPPPATTPRRRPTIQDLAREGGVSASTASRALSGRGYVSAPVRDRVLAAAAQIGYVPDANARSLRSRSSTAVGVLISDLRNSFYAHLAAGIEQQLRASGYHAIVVNSDGREQDEVEGARTFMAMRVSGAILTPVSDQAVRMLLGDGIPVVQADRRVDELPSDSVLSDNARGAREMTQHLVDLGHQRIALLLDETAWTTGKGRLAGFRSAMRRAKIPVDRDLIIGTSFDVESARAAVHALLDRRPDVTALFAANNMLAEAACQVLQERGLRSPDDVSLVAYDDVAWMTMVSPQVTTVDQHTEEFGQACARLLVDRLTGRLPADPVTRLIEPSLLIRGSSGAPASRRSAVPAARRPVTRRTPVRAGA